MTNGKFSCKQPLQRGNKTPFLQNKTAFFQKKTPYFLKKTAFYLRSLPLLQKKGSRTNPLPWYCVLCLSVIER